jgi:hypothetical protein
VERLRVAKNPSHERLLLMECKIEVGLADFSAFGQRRMFSCILQCDNCQGFVAVTGTVEEDVSGRGGGDGPHPEQQYGGRGYHPLYCEPALRICNIPETCRNEQIREELDAAFRVYWCDPRACMNHIRQVVELLLDEMKIRKTKSGRGTGPLPLHHRIDLLAKKHSAVGKKMMALKWLGNAASHRGLGKHKDALDGFELLEFVLDEWYGQQSKKRVDQITDQLIRRKGKSRHRW